MSSKVFDNALIGSVFDPSLYNNETNIFPFDSDEESNDKGIPCGYSSLISKDSTEFANSEIENFEKTCWKDKLKKEFLKEQSEKSSDISSLKKRDIKFNEKMKEVQVEQYSKTSCF